MAAITCDFFSDELEMGTTVSVVLPQVTREQIGVDTASTGTGSTGTGSTGTGSTGPAGDLPVLYLLHGLSDDHSAWTRYTSIERYAAEAGIAVVMPAVGRSFCADEAHGHRYWTYVSEELPEVMRAFFRISDRPQDTFVAGLSMGGYGALKLALTHPGRYAAAASLSGALDVAAVAGLPQRRALFDRVFDGVPGPGDDLFALLATADGATLPPLHVSCGTADPLFPMSQRMVAEARVAGAEVTTDFRPGAHEWGLWDAVIHDVIAWLPVRR